MKETAAKAFVAFVAVLAGVFLLTAGAALLSGGEEVSAPNTASVTEVQNDQYNADRFDIDTEPGTAEIEMESDVENQTVLIHAGPGVLERELQPIVNGLTANDHEVMIRSEGPELGFDGIPLPGVPAPPQPADDEGVNIADDLDDAHALLSIGVGDYEEDEIEAVEELVESEGRVVLLTDPQDSFDVNVGMAELQSTLGVFTEPGYVYNLEENDLNYQRVFVEPRQASELTDGVDSAVFDTATPVGTASGSEKLGPSHGSELSTTRDSTDAPVMVRNGNTVLAGDTEFISPENALRADTDELIGNLADFLVTGDRELEAADEDDEEIEGDLEAVNTAGFFETSSETENQARDVGLELEDGTVEVAAAIDGNSWEATEIETTALGEDEPGPGIDVELPDGLSGEIHPEDDHMTLEGTFVFDLDEVQIEFEVSAVTDDSGALTGSADLDTDGGSAVVVDNEFTVGGTGDSDFDEALGLPTEEPGLSWFEMELDLDLDPDAIGSETADDSGGEADGEESSDGGDANEESSDDGDADGDEDGEGSETE